MEHTLETHELAGGAKLLVINMKSAASNYFGSYVRAGWRFADRKKFDLPHLLEHLAFEGNKQYPDALDFKFTIETLGTSQNASTSDKLVRYHFSSVPDHLLTIVEIAANQLLNPLFNPDRVQDEKRIIEKEWTRRIKNDVSRLWMHHFMRQVPKAYMTHEDIIKSLQYIEREDIADYHAKTHVPANTTFTLVGQFTAGDISAVVKLLNSYLNPLQAGKKKSFVSLYDEASRRVIDAYDSHIDSEHHFQISWRHKGKNDQAQPALMILKMLLTGGLGGRITMKARDAGLTYGTSSGYANDIDMSGMGVSDRTQPHLLHELFDLCMRELQDVVSGNFSDSEFKRAHGLIEGSLQRSNQTPGALAGWYGYDFAMDNELESPQAYLKRLMAVTKEDVVRVGSGYVNKDNWTLTLVGTGLDKETDRYREILDRYFD